jgi:hypothetical protein
MRMTVRRFLTCHPDKVLLSSLKGDPPDGNRLVVGSHPQQVPSFEGYASDDVELLAA